MARRTLLTAVLLLIALVGCGSSDEPAWVTRERARLEQERAAIELDRAAQAKERAQLEAGRHGQGAAIAVAFSRVAAPDVDLTRPSLVVVMASSGKIHVDRHAVNDDELDRLLRAAYVADHDVQVVIQAERGVAHARVVGVMERAKAVGIRRLGIGTSAAP